MFSYVDHTLLKATSTWEQIQKLCGEALKFGAASVCIPSCYVGRVHEKYGAALNICTVIGFPLGYSVTEAKVLETKLAVQNGASEIDMVINICDVKNGDFDKVRDEIKAVKDAAGDAIVKVIVEACYLTQEEKTAMCRAVTEAGADFIKTSTGFGTGGAVLEDILLFKEHIGKDVKIKAAGGVKTSGDMEAFVIAGCDRIGTSSAVDILIGKGLTSEAY